MHRPTLVFEPPSIRRVRPINALRRLGEFSDLFVTLSVHRLKVRYAQSRLGLLWALIQPVAMMLVFTLMFTFLRTMPGGDVPFPLFAYSALLPWTMFASGLANASASLTANASLLSKVYFPREILPLSYIVVALVDMAIASLVLAGLMLWFAVPVSATVLWAVPAIVLLTGLLVGLGLFLSALQTHFRDVGLAMPVVLQVWLFATPVLYPLDAVAATLPSPLYAMYILNPMAGIVETFRRGVVLNQGPDLAALALSALVVAAIVPAAFVYFKHVELTMADVV
jgi:lipopolysaccharide transport system permease protein